MTDNIIRKGTEHELTITALSSEGKGISRQEGGFVVFCDQALPGDTVRAMIKKKKHNYAEAEITEIITKSDSRTEPKCRHFGICGGCKLQNYDYDKQLEYKTSAVKNAFERIGGFENLTVPAAIGCGNIFYYRNKMEFSFSDDKWVAKEDIGKERERFALGLHVPKFHSKIIDITECHLQSELSYNIVNFSREFFKQKGAGIYSTRTHDGYLRFLLIRTGTQKNTAVKDTAGDVMVNLITYNYDEILISEYREKILELFPQITTLVNSFTQKKAQVAFAEEMVILKGHGYIYEYLNSGGREYKFKISPNSFFQTNTKQAERLYKIAAEFAELKPADRVLDLYCGAGSISIFISGNVERVKGVELIKEAIMSAEENAEQNGVKNTEFELSDIKDYLVRDKEGADESSGFNKVIVDPPRSGLHPDICEILSNTRHEKIVYVSCNPGTQARDLQIICSKGNYRLGRIQPVDMFPQTYHVENVAELISVKC